jgi:iron complex transport system permease protein
MTGVSATYFSNRKQMTMRFLLMGLLVLLLFALNISLGSIYIPVKQVFLILFGNEPAKASWGGIILDTRLPQALTAAFAGAALGVSGLMMQTLFRNPLAGPSVLGISSGASLGVAILMMASTLPGFAFLAGSGFGGNFSIVIAAFAGALAVLLLIMFLASKFRSHATILIIGIMIAYVVTAVVGILQFYSMKENLQSFVFWGLGSFAGVSWHEHLFFGPITGLGIFLSVLMIKPMNALLLGDNYARNLGFNTKRVSLALILVSGILVAAVTAYCGPIAFLGIAVPHLSRNLFRTSNHLVNVPGTLLAGMLLALVCNLIARLPGFDGALPINAITSIIGAPVVIWVIIRQNHFQKLQ